MEQLSHNGLVHILKHAISRHGIPLDTLSAKANIKHSDLLGVLSGQLYATPRFLARLGYAMNLNLSTMWLRYSVWRFEVESQNAAPKPPRKRAATILDAVDVAKQVILACPDRPAKELAQELRDSLLLDMSYLLAQITQVRREQQTGDYHG